jgi:hypothetical protein
MSFGRTNMKSRRKRKRGKCEGKSRKGRRKGVN